MDLKHLSCITFLCVSARFGMFCCAWHNPDKKKPIRNPPVSTFGCSEPCGNQLDAFWSGALQTWRVFSPQTLTTAPSSGSTSKALQPLQVLIWIMNNLRPGFQLWQFYCQVWYCAWVIKTGHLNSLSIFLWYVHLCKLKILWFCL